MPVRDKGVLPAIVIEVEEEEAETERRQARLTHSGLIGLIREYKRRFLAEERVRFAREVAHENVALAIVLRIRDVDAHSGPRHTVCAIGNARIQADLSKRAVSVVAEEIVRRKVISDDYVRVAVAVDVPHGYA